VQGLASGAVPSADPRWTSIRALPTGIATAAGDGWDLPLRPSTLADLDPTAFLGLRQQHQDLDLRVVLHADLAEGEETQVLESWQKALDAVRTGDRTWAAQNLDWAIKERLFTQVMERRGIDLEDPAIERLDLAYHDIDPARGVFYALQRRGLAPTVLPEERLERSRTQAPTTTRAHLRGQVVTAAQEHGVDHVVDWTTLRLTRQGAMPVQVLDPFATEHPAVEALLEEIRAQGGSSAVPPPA
jgi:proteasome accessory factor A